MLDRFGARPTALLALVISACGYLLVWSTTLSVAYYNHHFYLLSFFFLIAGVGGGLTYMAGTASNVRNYGAERRGTVVGILHASLSAGPALIMVVYNSCFVNGHLTDEENQNLAGFFVFIVIAFVIVNALGMAIYGHYPPETESEDLSRTDNKQTISFDASSLDNEVFVKDEDEGDKYKRKGSVHFRTTPPERMSLSERTYSYTTSPSIHDSEFSRGGTCSDSEQTHLLGGSEDATTPHRVSFIVKAFRTFPGFSMTTPTTSEPDVAQSSIAQREVNSVESTQSYSYSAQRSVEVLRRRASGVFGSTTEVYSNVNVVNMEATMTGSTLGQTLKAIFSRDFQLLYWPFIILAAQQMMFVQNLTTILKSIGHEELNAYFPYITPILGTISKPLLGFASDYFITIVPRSGFITIGCVANVINWLLCIFYIDTVAMVLVATTICDLAAYTVYAVGPAMMIEKFGMTHFSRNWGLVMGGFAILTALLLSLFGIFYDLAVSVDDVTSECLGSKCFATNSVVSMGFSTVAFICMIIYMYLEDKSQRE